jgi:hypothetical protein
VVFYGFETIKQKKMKQIENTLQDLKCILIEDGYTEANIVMRTLIKAQEQVKNCSIPDFVESSSKQECYKIEGKFCDCSGLCRESY